MLRPVQAYGAKVVPVINLAVGAIEFIIPYIVKAFQVFAAPPSTRRA